MAAKKRNLPVCVHAEDEKTVQQNMAKAKQQNWNHAKYHSKIRTGEAERIAIENCLKLQQKIGNQLHVCHVSSAEGLQVIEEAKERFPDLLLSCETTPHHLFLSEEDANELENFLKVNPSIKSKQDQKALWKGIQKRSIDCVSSDHAPHTLSEKQQPYFSAPSGMPGVETMIPLLADAVHEEKLEWKDIERLCGENPQRVFGFRTSGCYTVIDPAVRTEIQNDHVFSKCGWNSFAGRKLSGKIDCTIVNGTTVFENGAIRKENRGVGKIVQRS